MNWAEHRPPLSLSCGKTGTKHLRNHSTFFGRCEDRNPQVTTIHWKQLISRPYGVSSVANLLNSREAHRSPSMLERPLVPKAPNSHGDPVSNQLPPPSVRGGTDPTISGSHLFPLPFSIGGQQRARAPCHCSQKKILATFLYPTS